MTGFEIETLPFHEDNFRGIPDPSGRLSNWPAVYAIHNESTKHQRPDVYVGETGNALLRMRQHRRDDRKKHLEVASIVLDDTFHRSACYDLESNLIQWLYSDAKFTVINANDGHRNEDYAGRQSFQSRFREIFEALRRRNLFDHSLIEIENSDLFKYSPFKALVPDQEQAVETILESLFEAIDNNVKTTMVVSGNPGTGKTVVGISLMKTLVDIARAEGVDDGEQRSAISDFFAEGFSELLRGKRFGLVIPQQSLRESIKNVFDRAPGLHKSMVMTAFEVGKSPEPFDVLVVDEAHRLNQRANQSTGFLNSDFRDINERLFGEDSVKITQLDWIKKQCQHTILLMDGDQSVRPADLAPAIIQSVVRAAKESKHFFPLGTQMRVKSGADYVGYVKNLLAGASPTVPDLGEYEFRLYDDVGEMEQRIRECDIEHGLARLVAGYAWSWESNPGRKAMKSIPLAERPYDIEIEGHQWRWNSTVKDWINSANALDEVGSIHTVQGYDLNYAGVIIGRDLWFDESARRVRFDRAHYRDAKGVENNPKLGITYSDEDIERYVKNIYAVLMSRGIRGTFVYVCDEALREHFRELMPGSG